MQEKKCSKCGVIKPLSEFSKRNSTNSKIGVLSRCKDCKSNDLLNYFHTKEGLILRIYCDQKKSSKKRGHRPPSYTKEELRDWCFSQKLFHELYDNWKINGFNKAHRPSCDRTDDYKGYSLSRLQLMTWKENNIKARKDRKNGINNKNNKAIVGVHAITGESLKFYSQHEAARKTGVHQSAISVCCLGKVKTAGGYTWKFNVN